MVVVVVVVGGLVWLRERDGEGVELHHILDKAYRNSILFAWPAWHGARAAAAAFHHPLLPFGCKRSCTNQIIVSHPASSLTDFYDCIPSSTFSSLLLLLLLATFTGSVPARARARALCVGNSSFPLFLSSFLSTAKVRSFLSCLLSIVSFFPASFPVACCPFRLTAGMTLAFGRLLVATQSTFAPHSLHPPSSLSLTMAPTGPADWISAALFNWTQTRNTTCIPFNPVFLLSSLAVDLSRLPREAWGAPGQ